MQELIQQMANVQYTENMTEEQVDAMAGSETLRQQASLFGATRNYKVVRDMLFYLSSILRSNHSFTDK
jgi:THO complex subunit 2